MPKMVKHILSFVTSVLILASCSNFDKIQRSDSMEEKLNAAFDYYEKKEYYKASVLFDELVPLMKGRSETEKAHFYHAYCYYNMKQYIMSAHYFKDFTETYPRSAYSEEARFMYAKSLYKDSPKHNLDQTNTSSALRALQTFASRYPGSSYMEEVNQMTDVLNKKLEIKSYENAKIYYKLGLHNVLNYKSAIVAFDNFSYNYPESKHNEELAFLKIDAQYQVAKSSLLSLQRERYYDTIEFYQIFIDKYPDSKYRKSAEHIFESCRTQISKLEN